MSIEGTGYPVHAFHGDPPILYGAIIASIRDYLKKRGTGKYAEYHLAFGSKKLTRINLDLMKGKIWSILYKKCHGSWYSALYLRFITDRQFWAVLGWFNQLIFWFLL